MRDEVGTYITQGIAVGMTDRAAMASVNKSAGVVSSGVVGAFGNLASPGTLNGGIVSSGAFAAQTAGTSNSSTSLVFNVSGADPSRNAEAIRKVLRQERLI